MRLFIGVPVDGLRPRLEALLLDLRSSGADLRWTRPENLHLTLSFLGEVRDDAVSAVERALAAAARGRPPFSLTLAGLGVFPSVDRPRTVWLGVSEGAETIGKLAAALRGALASGGLAPAEGDREFAAHLTLGRLRSPAGFDALSNRLGAAGEPLALEVRRILLYRSLPSSEGSSYSVLREEPLG